MVLTGIAAFVVALTEHDPTTAMAAFNRATAISPSNAFVLGFRSVVPACSGQAWTGGWLYDAYGSYFWRYIGSFGIGLGAVAIALTFRPPREFSVVLPAPSLTSSA